MTTTEKTVTWGLLGVIAWQLLQRQGGTNAFYNPAAAGSSGGGIDTVPGWVKALSGSVMGQDFFTTTSGMFARCSQGGGGGAVPQPPSAPPPAPAPPPPPALTPVGPTQMRLEPGTGLIFF